MRHTCTEMRIDQVVTMHREIWKGKKSCKCGKIQSEHWEQNKFVLENLLFALIKNIKQFN